MFAEPFHHGFDQKSFQEKRLCHAGEEAPSHAEEFAKFDLTAKEKKEAKSADELKAMIMEKAREKLGGWEDLNPEAREKMVGSLAEWLFSTAEHLRTTSEKIEEGLRLLEAKLDDSGTRKIVVDMLKVKGEDGKEKETPYLRIDHGPRSSTLSAPLVGEHLTYIDREGVTHRSPLAERVQMTMRNGVISIRLTDGRNMNLQEFVSYVKNPETGRIVDIDYAIERLQELRGDADDEELKTRGRSTIDPRTYNRSAEAIKNHIIGLRRKMAQGRGDKGLQAAQLEELQRQYTELGKAETNRVGRRSEIVDAIFALRDARQDRLSLYHPDGSPKSAREIAEVKAERDGAIGRALDTFGLPSIADSMDATDRDRRREALLGSMATDYSGEGPRRPGSGGMRTISGESAPTTYPRTTGKNAPGHSPSYGFHERHPSDAARSSTSRPKEMTAEELKEAAQPPSPENMAKEFHLPRGVYKVGESFSFRCAPSRGRVIVNIDGVPAFINISGMKYRNQQGGFRLGTNGTIEEMGHDAVDGQTLFTYGWDEAEENITITPHRTGDYQFQYVDDPLFTDTGRSVRGGDVVLGLDGRFTVRVIRDEELRQNRVHRATNIRGLASKAAPIAPGSIWRSIGRAGNSPDGTPHAFYIAPDGKLYSRDMNRGTIRRFDDASGNAAILDTSDPYTPREILQEELAITRRKQEEEERQQKEIRDRAKTRAATIRDSLKKYSQPGQLWARLQIPGRPPGDYREIDGFLYARTDDGTIWRFNEETDTAEKVSAENLPAEIQEEENRAREGREKKNEARIAEIKEEMRSVRGTLHMDDTWVTIESGLKDPHGKRYRYHVHTPRGMDEPVMFARDSEGNIFELQDGKTIQCGKKLPSEFFSFIAENDMFKPSPSGIVQEDALNTIESLSAEKNPNENDLAAAAEYFDGLQEFYGTNPNVVRQETLARTFRAIRSLHERTIEPTERWNNIFGSKLYEDAEKESKRPITKAPTATRETAKTAPPDELDKIFTAADEELSAQEKEGSAPAALDSAEQELDKQERTSGMPSFIRGVANIFMGRGTAPEASPLPSEDGRQDGDLLREYIAQEELKTQRAAQEQIGRLGDPTLRKILIESIEPAARKLLAQRGSSPKKLAERVGLGDFDEREEKWSPEHWHTYIKGLKRVIDTWGPKE